ncbi:MAG: Flp pilus assembly protein CpaB [Candidatus Omnitrophota bacterium]
MPRQKLFLMIGITFALIAAFATKFYLDQQKDEITQREKARLAKARANEVSVMVAKEEIPAGSILTQSHVTMVSVPVKDRSPNAYTGAIDGMLVVSPISKGEQIVGNKIVPPRHMAGLAESTPIGKRAITIMVDNMGSLVGMVKPGDNVDVLFITTVPKKEDEGERTSSNKQVNILPLFQNVSILAVGQEIGTTFYGQQKKDSREASLITLALSPKEANMVAFALEHGKIRLVLRSPKDSQISLTETVDWETLFSYIMPAKFEKKDTVESMPTIEIYRGAKKDKIPISR